MVQAGQQLDFVGLGIELDAHGHEVGPVPGRRPVVILRGEPLVPVLAPGVQIVEPAARQDPGPRRTTVRGPVCISRSGDDPGSLTGQPVPPGAAPSVTGASVNGATLTFTFDGRLDTTASPSAGAFSLGGTNAATGVTAATFRSGDATRLGGQGPMAGSPVAGAAPLGRPGVGAAGAPMAAAGGSLAGGPGMPGGTASLGRPGVGAAGPMGATVGPAGGLNGVGLPTRGLGGGDLLAGSLFKLNRETRHGGILSLWSRGARSHFAGREGALGLNGDVQTAAPARGASWWPGA